MNQKTLINKEKEFAKYIEDVKKEPRFDIKRKLLEGKITYRQYKIRWWIWNLIFVVLQAISLALIIHFFIVPYIYRIKQ